MAGLVVRRLVGGLAVLLVLSAIVYGLFYALPSDPAQLVCGPKTCQADQLALIRHALGLDQPLYLQYWHFLVGIVAGRDFSGGNVTNHCAAPCLGYSFQTDQPVTSILLDRLPVSFSLVGGGFVLSVLLGSSLGVLSALRRGRLADRLTTVLIFGGSSIPAFITALLLLGVFCVYLRWLPFPSYVPFTSNPALWAQNLLLPWIVILLVNMSTYARLTRTGMLETLTEDHIRTARAYGLSERRVIGMHALRGALTPLATIAAIDLGQNLATAVLTETTFGLPGLGQLLVQSVTQLDLPVVVGLVMLTGFMIVLANVIADLLYAVLDRRVSMT